MSTLADRTQFEILDAVELRRAVEGFKAGTKGAVVDRPAGDTYIVEIVGGDGETLGLIVAAARDLRAA